MPLKNLTQAPPSHLAHSDPRMPSIRLISAIPSAAGSSDPNSTIRVFDDPVRSSSPTPWDSMPPPPPVPPLKHHSSRLLPKKSTSGLAEASSSATRLVPKKSKRRLLGSLGNALPFKENARGNDFSDVVRRVAAGNGSSSSPMGSAKLKGGFEIYVDPSADPDMSDIMVVKKQKSRAALNDMGWGPTNADGSSGRGVLGEVTNGSSSNLLLKKEKEKEGGGMLKVKVDEDKKWWSIGRGRKDSKDERKVKEKEKENGARSRASSPVPPPRSQTPDPFKGVNAQSEQSRGRFNSLDAGILLGLSKRKSNNVLASEAPTVREPPKASSPPPTMRRGSHGDMLSNPQLHPQTQPRKMERIPTPPQMTYSRSATPTFGGLFSGPGAQTGGLEVPAPTNASNQGSIALRAMRSVKSFARIGSWAQGKSEDMPKKEKTVKEKKKAKEGGEEKKSRRVSKKEKEKDDTVRRMSGSSFEAGALSSGPMSDGKAGSVSRKHSILGLGLPSSMRLPRMRSGSAASSLFGATPSPAPPVPPIPNRFGTVNSVLSTASSNGGGSDNAGTINAQRLSVDSAVAPEGRRRTSIQSTASSLRPNSITSTLSGTSTRSRGSADRCSSGASIRWDEEGIQRAKAEREKEVLTKRESVKKAGKKTSRDSRRTSESRRRTGISDIFPEVMGGGASKPAQPEPEVRRYPIVTIEEATADGHGDDLNEPIMEESEEEEESVQVVATPMKKPRARPLSEQLLGKPRPLPVHEGEDGVLGILSAATNDLAQLINNLDLEATPATPDMTPLRPSASPFGSEPSTSMSRSIEYNGSPLKKKEIVGTSRGVRGIGVRASAASISSLRPYGQSKTVNNGHPTIRGKPSFSETMLGKAIPSWPLPEKTSLAELRAKLKPVVSPKASSVTTAKPVELPSPPLPSFIKAHKRSMTPIREPDPAPVFEPLQPPPSKRQANVVKAKSKVSPPPERIKDTFDDSSEDEDRYRTLRAKKTSKGPSERTFGSLVTDKASGARTIGRGSKMSTASSVSSRKMSVEKGVPMSREARRMLGMSGTMGGSVVSAYQVELDESDPDSDVPEELRHILKKDEAETITYQGVGVEENQSDDEEYRDDSSFTGRLHQFDEDDMTMDIRAPRSRSVSPFDPAALARFSCSTEVNMSEAEIQQAHLLPVFRAQLITDTAALDADFDEDCFTASDENNTKRSFNFTEELAKLTEAGDSDRRSFVEQLENAFRTPAKIDLRADFGVTLDVPPVPPLPDYLRRSIAPPVEAGSSYVSEGDSELSIGVGRDACSDESHVMESPVPAFFRDSQSSKTSMSSKKSSSPSFKMGESASRSMDMKQPSIDIASVSPSTAGTTSSLKSKASTLSSASRRSDHSDGQLNRSFKFGGLSSTSLTPAKVPQSPGHDSLFDNISMEDSPDSSHCRPLTLSDVIPPPSHVREVSFSSSMLDDYEDSALKSLIAETMSGVPQNSNRPQPRERTISEASLDPRVSRRFSNFIPLTRPSSGVSFAGLDSYDEVRRGFEFNDQRPNFYPGTNVPTAHSRGHRAARDSVFSIASVSSYGRVIRDGATDPFDYGVAPPSHMPSLQERSHEEDMTQSSIGTQMYDESFDMSTQVEDTFSFSNHRPVLRRRVDSDASSFYCGVPASTARGVRRRSSNFSVSSISGMPPVSMYTRGFGHHRRSSSVTSASSIALNYAHGGVGARAILARHRREVSVDSGYSDFSPMRPTARPGIGDKMFETAAPLAAIPRSPEQSVSGDFLSADYGPNRTSFGSFDYYDSIIDADDAYSYRFHPQRDSIAEEYEDEERPSSISDSLFDQTRLRSSADSASLFGNDNDSYIPPHQFRPLSMMSSIGDPNSPMRDDDTMISMIGGGHVRRRSVVSMIAASPCVRMEKKATHRRTARAVLQEMKKAEKQARVVVPSPAKPKTVELKPSIVSTASTHFGDDRMVSAQHGLLARQSLEESVLVASGEDRSVSFQAPVFSRPKPVSRSRSSTCTSESSGRDTPPLSPSDGTSVSGGSFSSIDMAEMSASLSNVSQPSSTLASARARAQNIGHSHRRRYSRAQITRSSVYETIDEEDTTWSSSSSPAQSMFSSATNKLQPAVEDSTAVYVVGSDTESIYNADDPSTWDDERGIVALRKFYNLKDEAHTTVQESQRTWIDTPFSLYALQTFDPPRQPEAMKAMLEQSLRAFGPLPAELRRMRSRKNSRPSPYPAARTFKTSMTSSPFECPPQAKLSTSTTATTKTQATVPTPVLKEKKLNTVNHVPESHKPTSLFVMKDNNIEDSAQRPTAAAKAALGSGTIRARVPSAARRSALGWAKRSNGPKSSSDKKENVVGEGSIVMTPADGLRLNRPRPRNSRTPASQARPIRV